MFTQSGMSLENPVKIISMRVLSGANYFSSGQVIVMRIDLGKYDEVFTNMIPGFYETLKASIPSLYEHHCSPGHIGGFLERVMEGTLLGHVIEHVSIELQTLAGMDVSYGKTRSANDKGVYNVVYRYFDERAGLLAGQLSVHIINSILTAQEFQYLDVLDTMSNMYLESHPSAEFTTFLEYLEDQKIPLAIDYSARKFILGTGKYVKELAFDEIAKYPTLFPDARRIRIPVISITGSEGKSELARLLYLALQADAMMIGRIGNNKAFVNDKPYTTDTCESFAQLSKLLLIDAEIDLAILETPVETIVESGLPYDYARIGVLLNILDQHMGCFDFKVRSDLAYAKSVVIEQVLDKGYAILNADDKEVMDLKRMVYSRVAVFSKSATNPAIEFAMNDGKDVAVFIRNGYITISHLRKFDEIIPISDVPYIHLEDTEPRRELILALCACLYCLQKDTAFIKATLISCV